ncbi:MAG: molybdenum cofactor carrier protein [Myxococcales bacterium]|nr:molybdenum cofactor carrier protein [Myxococcales bacterium]
MMGSGTSADVSRCAELGRSLAAERVHLLTGGGRGVMDAVSRAFHGVEGRQGLVIGVLPAAGPGEANPPAGYPNPWVELSIQTHLHLSGNEGTNVASRNHINVLSSDVIVALPGALGTRSEVELALRYRVPIVAYLQDRAEIPQLPDSVTVAAHLEDIIAFVRRALGRSP